MSNEYYIDAHAWVERDDMAAIYRILALLLNAQKPS